MNPRLRLPAMTNYGTLVWLHLAAGERAGEAGRGRERLEERGIEDRNGDGKMQERERPAEGRKDRR